MFTEKERAKWRERVARWRNGELVYDAGRIVEKSDNTSVQKQEPVLSVKRLYGKVVDPKLVERKLQLQPVIKQGKNYTQRRVEEESKPTWLTTAADIAHGVGEGAMFASNFIPFGRLFNVAINSTKNALSRGAKSFAQLLNPEHRLYLYYDLGEPSIKMLTPTERVFSALGKPVPETIYEGNPIGMAVMKLSPTIKNLRSLGVNTDLLSPEDLTLLLNLRKRSIQDPHLMGRRAEVDTNLSSIKVFDGELDANGDFWPIGDATFDKKPISNQNAFVSAISDGPTKVPYSEFLDDNLRGIHMIHNYSTYPELKGTILPRKHVAQDIYNVAIDYLRSSGKGIGLYSGKELLTPQATMRTVTPKNYRMITFPDTGVWRYGNKMLIGDSWALLEPRTQVIPYKNVELFNINNIDDLGNFGIDWTRGSAY